MIADFGCCAGNNEGSTGDPRYAAPESFRNYKGSTASDVWSLGVTMFELVTGGLLIYTYKPNIKGWQAFTQNPMLVNTFMTMAQRGYPVEIEKHVTGSRAQRLLARMLAVDRYQRDTCDGILKASWFDLVEEEEVEIDDSVAATLSNRAKGSGCRIGLLNLISQVLQGEAIEYYRLLWDKFEPNGDGIMELTEFTEMMKVQFNIPGPKNASVRKSVLSSVLPVEQTPTAEEIFSYADTDGRGFITFDEFVGLMFDPDKLDTDQKIKYFKSAFAQMAKGDERITEDELQAYFGEDVDVSEIFGEMDTNGSGRIDFEEFMTFVDKL
jgi:Ca2+-binding EF-hand superfamily protein